MLRPERSVMSVPVVLRAVAQDEAARWYEEKQAGLGSDFLAELQRGHRATSRLYRLLAGAVPRHFESSGSTVISIRSFVPITRRTYQRIAPCVSKKPRVKTLGRPFSASWSTKRSMSS